jgi:ParB-like chromosome segregation protein Spo0J
MDPVTLKVELVKIDRLFCNPANPRINDPAVPHVAASLKRFGWQQPIVARPSGEVIAGNTRLKAAQSLGMKEVPVVWFQGSELDATAYGIADNRSHEFSAWDNAELVKLLEELRLEDSLDATGFGVEDINQLLLELGQSLEPVSDVDPDLIPEPPQKATTRSGDLWISLGIQKNLRARRSDSELKTGL